MIAEVLRDCERCGLLSRGDSVIAALSGGADSVALLHFLISIKEKYQLKVSAAHLNHGIRGAEAAGDELFCKLLCRAWQVELFVRHADVPALARQRGISEELCGREERYAFFEELAREKRAKIATAHTASDNAETLLFHLARGTSLRGAAAIPPKRGNVIRPLLSRTRAEIEAYCEANHLRYVTDSTNLSDEYTRNRIRHHVIPALREVNPALEAALTRFTRDAAEVSNFLERQAERLLSEARTTYGYRAGILREADIAVRKAALSRLCRECGEAPEHRHVDLLLAVLRDGGAVELNKTHTLVCDGGLLRVSTAAAEQAEIPFDKPLSFVFQGVGYRADADDSLFENNTLLFRSTRAGDHYSFQKRKITKPMGKALREIGVPAEKRGSLLCLCEGSTVLWCEALGWSEQGRKYTIFHHLVIEKQQ